jgi:hypothetical protein
MRNIKKKIKVREVECVLYDRASKEERKQVFKVPETQEQPTLPENCVLLEQRTLSEKEVSYSMTPETFIEHATADVAE